MTLRTVRIAAAVFFVLFTLSVTWPGYTLANRVHPLVLGLPFSLAWIAFWVVMAFGVLLWVDRVESRAENPDAKRDAPEPPR